MRGFLFLLMARMRLIQSVIKIAAGPDGDIEEGLQGIDDVANRLAGVLAPSKLKVYRDAQRELLMGAVIEGHIRRGEYKEAQAIIDIRTGMITRDASKVAKEHFEAANAEGVDGALVLSIAQTESGLDPDAKPPTQNW